MRECPRPDELRRLISDRLSPDSLQSLEAHLDTCGGCRQHIDRLADVRCVVPERLPPGHGLTPESPALRRAIERLQAHPDPTAGGPRLPFLHPTDRPGFLGRLGAYDIRREIGRGGMGVVFEGFDPELDRTVAVKVLSPLSATTDEARARFLREARAAAALEHEHVVTVHAVDHVDGMPLLVMQYVAGESLADRLDREGRLPFAEVVRIGAQVARGLAAAHAGRLVHRDIKPANILLEAGTGRAKIVDFGLAKAAGDGSLTVAGTVAGTPEFMSPEQAAGGPGEAVVDARSDLFSLGVVLHAACGGGSPFRGATPLLTLDRVRRDEAAPLSQIDPAIPPWFCSVVERLLMKDPADRIQSAAELADILEAHPEPPTAVRVGPPARAIRRVRWVVPVAGLLVMAAVSGVHFRRSGEAPRDEPAPAERPRPTGFVIAGRPDVFRDLAGAVTAARDGDVIEVNGDGPFQSPSISTGGKRLVIRAVAPSRPVFVMQKPAPRAAQPFLTADADLRLEGLEIHWVTEVPIGWSEAEQLARCAVASTAGRLALDRCRVVAGRTSICVGAAGRDVELCRSHLIAGELGLCAYWRPTSGGFRAEGCQFEGRVALSVSTAPDTANRSAVPLHLEGNTFATDKALHLQVDFPPRRQLRVAARHNLFNTPQLVVLFAVRPLRNLDAPRPEVLIDLLRSLVEWSEEANVYRRGGQFLVAGAVKHGGRQHPARVDCLRDWQQLWKLPPTGSVAGVLRFADRPSGAHPLYLLDVTDASGAVPAAGANPTRLGPGIADHDTAAAGPR
jgi:hypothetical protein